MEHGTAEEIDAMVGSTVVTPGGNGAPERFISVESEAPSCLFISSRIVSKAMIVSFIEYPATVRTALP